MSIKPSKKVMQAVIAVAESQKTPFGAALVMGDEIFVTASHRYEDLKDPRSHAVARVIQQLRELIQVEKLSGYVLYSTCEPCANCFKTALNADISAFIIGCKKSEMREYLESTAYAERNHDPSKMRETDVQYGVMRDQCLRLFEIYV